MKRACVVLLWLSAVASAAEPGLVGHWKLDGKTEFMGRRSFVEVPDAPGLRFGTSPFSVAMWVHTTRGVEDVPGDLLSKYDPARRKGFTLALSASAAGYNATGDARHVHFGLDDARSGSWIDCGRPGGKSHNSDALTVFEGHLYAGTCDAPTKDDWARVYRTKDGRAWEDCGRVGTGRTRGVYAMVVHDGALYAATSASHGPQPDSMDPGRVYRFKGGTTWEDVGRPGMNHRVNALASYRGKLYACGFNIGKTPGQCYVLDGGQWKACGEFDGWPHTLAVHDGKLYTAYPKGEVFAYDGASWEKLGNPFGSTTECNQIHALGVYQGELHAGSWPKGRVAAWRDGKWVDRGRPGDATEVIALAVYNGALYAGTIPRAEVFRHDGDKGWTSLRRLFDPEGFAPVPVGSRDAQGVADWSRATSLTVFGGRLYASTGTCYRTMMEQPRKEEMRGKVYAYEAGANVSHDHDLGPGWKHVAAVRDGEGLRLYVNGRRSSSAAVKTPVDVSNEVPLLIGGGPTDSFHGRLGDVRLYDRALTDREVEALARMGRRSTPEGGE